MAKNFNQKTAENLFRHKLRTMIGSVAHTQNVADQAMELAGQFMTEDAQGNSDTYRILENVSCVCEEALLVLSEAICKEPTSSSFIRSDKSYQSEEASALQNHQNAQKLAELDQQRKNLLSLVCRILQAHPGYKLRPSELAAETVGDLSCLSQEARACLHNRMERDYHVRTSIEDI